MVAQPHLTERCPSQRLRRRLLPTGIGSGNYHTTWRGGPFWLLRV